MTRQTHRALALTALLLAATSAYAAPPAAPKPVTPGSVLDAAPATAWRPIAADDLLVMELKNGARVVLVLASGFAPEHVANIKAMARAGYYDGLWIERVQENYVVQWGDPDGKKPLPSTVKAKIPAEYERPATGLPFRPIPMRDVFAPTVGFVEGWPVAEDGGEAWLTHCYSMVGVGRGEAPDTGTGAELYVVNGQSPRSLDRNIAVVGRMIAGIEALNSLPRGHGPLGFYEKPEQMLPIVRVRLASAMPEAERPHFVILDTTAPTFDAWVEAKANRKDDFFIRPANAIDLCNVLPPVKEVKP